MNKHYLLLIPFFMLFCVLNGHAQTVTGKTVNQTGAPIVGVVVIIEHSGSATATTATTANATVTDALGRFELKTAMRPYKLTIQHLSYEEQVITSSDDDLGEIVLKDAAQAISAVVVKGERPIVQVEPGKLVYDIGRLSEGKVVKNAFEAIEKLPAIQDNNGKLEIIGALHGTTVIINGKPSVMGGEVMDFLKSIPVERLEKVETSYNAPPQWHILGAAINIVIKREPSELKGQLQASYSRDNRNSYDGTANLYVAGKRFSADLMASYRDFAGSYTQIEHNQHYVHDVRHDVNQELIGKNAGNKFTLYGSFGCKLKANKSLNLSYYTDIQPALNTMSNSTNNVFGASQNKTKLDGAFHGIAFTYESSKVNSGISYSYLGNNIFSDLTGSSKNVISTINNTVNYASAYVDVSNALPKKWTLGYGALFTYVNNKSKQILNADADAQLYNSSLDEYTANAYVNLGHTFKGGVNFSLTLKGEYYSVEDYDQFKFLPNLSLSYPISDSHNLQFSFSIFKDTPAYGLQRDYVRYFDAYKIERGNPLIRPASAYQADLSYILKNKYMFTFSYLYASDNIQDQWFMDPEKLQMVQQPLNIDFVSVYSLSISVPFQIGKFWSGRFDVMGNYRRFKAENWHGLSYDTSLWSAGTSLDNTFKVSSKPKISLSLSASYSAPSLMGIEKSLSSWSIDVGANYSFLKDRAILTLSCNDIFKTRRNVTETIMARQYQYFKSLYSTRTFTISFTYKFGGYQGLQYHNSNMGSDRM